MSGKTGQKRETRTPNRKSPGVELVMVKGPKRGDWYLALTGGKKI